MKLHAQFLIFLLSLFLAGSCWAQSSEESAGRAAEQAGRLREALAQYTVALSKASPGSADDQRLREYILALVPRITPRPAIPEEAERRMARGRAAVKAAMDEQGFVRAAAEFQEALKAAPWLLEAYFNLAVVQDRAGKHADALRNLKLFLAGSPSAGDAKQARELVYEIEYRQEDAQRAKAEAQRKAHQAEAVQQHHKPQPRLAGYWRDMNGSRYLLKVDGNAFSITRVMACWNPAPRDWDRCHDLRPDNTLMQFGTIKDGLLAGFTVNTINHRTRRVMNRDGSSTPCPVAAGNYPIARSQISVDGRQLTITAADNPAPNCPPFSLGADYRRDD